MDEVVFRRFQGEGVDFFNRTSLTLHQTFDAHLWKIPIEALPDFQWVLYQDFISGSGEIVL